MNDTEQKPIDRCTRYSIEKLASPDRKDLVQIFKDYWWIVDEKDNVLFNRGRNPMCNPNKKIVEQIRDGSYPGCDIRLVPYAYLSIRIPSCDFEFEAC